MLKLSGRDFLKLLDFTAEEIRYLLDLAKRLKAEKKAARSDGRPIHGVSFQGKNIALIFEKNSTRTRCAFEVAARDLNLGTTFLSPEGSQIGKKESIEDTARVLSRMYDGIEYRGFEQAKVEELARFSSVPVWNGLSNEFHPTQLLADLLTIEEHIGRLKGLRLSYLGDARYNMGNSYMVACAKMGMHYTACCPEEYFPDIELVKQCQSIAEESGGSISLSESVEKGCRNADVIATDVWVSMGEPAELWQKRIYDLMPYQVNEKVFSYAKPEAIFLHCLPSFHNTRTEIGAEIYEKYGISEMEVTDRIFESERSVVFDEAENRMHTIKAVVYATLGGI